MPPEASVVRCWVAIIDSCQETSPKYGMHCNLVKMEPLAWLREMISLAKIG